MEPVRIAALAVLFAALAAARALTRRGRRSSRPHASRAPSRSQRRAYPGDFTGPVKARYAPSLNGSPDPGEIVWTWVPYEDDHSRGKDRPVLIIGHDGTWLLCLMLTSKDHDRDAADEARWGRRWMDIGAGSWDVKRRPSEVRLDRVVRIHPDDVRREGAIMDRKVFDRIVKSL